MLGRLLIQKQLTNGHANGITDLSKDWKASFETIDWVNPNTRNLVEDGEFTRSISYLNSYVPKNQNSSCFITNLVANMFYVP